MSSEQRFAAGQQTFKLQQPQLGHPDSAPARSSARWLIEEHDDGVHHVTRYVQLFDSPLQRIQGYLQQAQFLLSSLRILYDFNKHLFYQAPWCFIALGAAKAVMALQGAGKVYATGLLLRQTQQYLQSELEEWQLLPTMCAVLVVGIIPALVRLCTLWPRGRIALLVNIAVDERLMAGFARIQEEDRESEVVKDLVHEASRLYVGEQGGPGPMRGFVGAEEVFGVMTKAIGVPLRLWAILKLASSARSLVVLLALFTLLEDRLFLSPAKRLWNRASNTLSLVATSHVRLNRLSHIMTSPEYASDVQMLGLAPWLMSEHKEGAGTIRQSDAALIGMRRFEIRHEGQRELHMALRCVFIAAILLGYSARARRAGRETLSVATWALVQQAAQDLSREVGSVQRDYHHLYMHCRQLVALDKFEKLKTQHKTESEGDKKSGALKIDGYLEGKLAGNESEIRDLALDVQHVSFSYPGRQELVLENVNLQVQTGEMVALVGLNGSGKSTLAKLIAGAYRVQPGCGAVLVQSQDVKALAPDELSKAVSTLPQKPTLLPMSIRDNIGLGCQDDEKIAHAARETGAMDFIQGHPDGFAALLAPPHIKRGRQQADSFQLFNQGDQVQIASHCRNFSREKTEVRPSLSRQEASLLTDQVTHRWTPPRMPSGGETQRLAMARALVQGSPILVLDEPTNNLDVQGTQQVLHTIRQLRGTRTLVVIVHHWPGVTDMADKVVLLEKGKVVQTGAHEALLKESGPYANLWALQMAGQPLEPCDHPESRGPPPKRGGRGRGPKR